MFQGCKVKIKIWWWWKAVQKLRIQPLGRQSVHAPAFLVRFLFMVWVGLDSNELDCFRRQVSTLLSWSLLIGTTNESSIYGQLLDQKENEAKQTECFLNGCVLFKKVFTGPELFPAPGAGHVLSGLLLQLVHLQPAPWGCLLLLGSLLSSFWSILPLALAVEKLSPVAGDVDAILHAHCEWFLVREALT